MYILLCMKRCWYLVFFLCAVSSQPSSHVTISSTRMVFFLSGDHKTMSGLRVVDSGVLGSGVSSPSQPQPADCRRFCLAWPWTTGLWPYFTKWWCSAVVLYGWTFLSPSCSRMSVRTANTLSVNFMFTSQDLRTCGIVFNGFQKFDPTFSISSNMFHKQSLPADKSLETSSLTFPF